MQLRSASSVAEAVEALRAGGRALAGGTELVPLTRDGLVRADTLVHIAEAVPRGVEASGSEPQSPLRIGAGTTLAELESVLNLSFSG